MIRPSIKGQRLVALFLCGCLLFNYPILSLFAGPDEVLGIPLLYAYVFVAWGLLIALMAVAVGHLSEADANWLIECHADLMAHVLRQQLMDLAAGVRPSNRVAISGLGREGSRCLARELRRLNDIVQELRGAVSA